MTGKLTLGYREAVALASSPLAAAGTVVRAHEFHRTVSVPAHGPSAAWRLSDGSEHGWASDSLLASYLHVHWAGVPAAAGAARRGADSRRAARVTAERIASPAGAAAPCVPPTRQVALSPRRCRGALPT